MIRQARAAALATATLAAAVGPALGQAAAPSSGGPVYVMKTAGQPERRVQVIKSETQPDGSILTDVKDLGSGTIYTLTNPAFLGKPAAPIHPSVVATAPPAAPIATPPAMAPGTPRPLFGQFPNQRMANSVPTATVKERLVPVESTPSNGLPQARERTADPLLAGAATTPAAMTARTPFGSGKSPNEPPTVMGKMFGDPLKNQPPPRVGVRPPTVDVAALAPKPQVHPGVTVVVPTAEPPLAVAPPPAPPAVPKVAVAVAPPPAPPAVPKVAVAVAPPPAPSLPAMPKTADSTVALAIPAIDANARPSSSTGLFDSQSTTTGVVLPTIAEPAAPPTVAPTVAVPAPPTESVAIAIPVPTAPMVGTNELPNDVRSMIEDIKTHKRPSFRMENATALAESAHARHPAAIEALLHGATNDKAGVVRGHCIARLSELGYSDPTYLKLLDAWTGDLEPAVRSAAIDAKAKLGGR